MNTIPQLFAVATTIVNITALATASLVGRLIAFVAALVIAIIGLLATAVLRRRKQRTNLPIPKTLVVSEIVLFANVALNIFLGAGILLLISAFY